MDCSVLWLPVVSLYLQSAVVVEELHKARTGGYSLGPNFSGKAGRTHELSKEDKIPGRTARQLMRSHGVRREGVRCNLLKANGDVFAFHESTQCAASSLFMRTCRFIPACCWPCTVNSGHMLLLVLCTTEQRSTLPKALRPPNGSYSKKLQICSY